MINLYLKNLNKLIKKNNFQVAFAIIIIILFLIIFTSFITEFSPLENNSRNRLQSPSSTHYMGTDEFGRDVFARVLYGARNSIQVGISVVILTIIFGGIVGILAGYYSKLDNIIMRILDGIMAFPGIIIAISLAAIWGGGKNNIIIALTFSYFPKMARIVRSSILSIKDLEYIESAKAIGASNSRIIFRHILKNSVSPIMVQASFNFARAILDEAALSFLGVGIMPPNPSLGGMISEARSFLTVAPWIITFPGIFIVIIVLSFNLIGDGLRDLLDPHLQKNY
ncbi:MAG: ABC transporter permease [Bacillota bacterium]